MYYDDIECFESPAGGQAWMNNARPVTPFSWGSSYSSVLNAWCDDCCFVYMHTTKSTKKARVDN